MNTDTNSLENRLHSLEITVGSLELLMYCIRGALMCMMPENGGLPRQMEMKDDGSFEYPELPQLPVSERNALIMLWHGEGKSVKEIQVLLYSRGHCTKKGMVIKSDTVQRVIDKVLAKGGRDGATDK
jgi:hypothetical protein